jgi:putative oxidoreductase
MLSKVWRWGDRHHPGTLDIVRLGLGILSVLKGFMFLENRTYIKWILSTQDLVDLSPEALTVVIFIVCFIHMTGGVLIGVGLYTRCAAAIQIPIVLAALTFNQIYRSAINSELGLSLSACLLLILFVIIGSGPFSVDRYIRNNAV